MFFKKIQNVPRPSEHPPVRGGKISKRLSGIKGCQYTVLPDNAYLSLEKRLHFRGPTLPVIALATSEVGPAVLLFVEEVCHVLRFQTNSVPRYQ